MILNFTTPGKSYLNIDTRAEVFNEKHDHSAQYIELSLDDFLIIQRKLDRDSYGYKSDIGGNIQ